MNTALLIRKILPIFVTGTVLMIGLKQPTSVKGALVQEEPASKIGGEVFCAGIFGQ